MSRGDGRALFSTYPCTWSGCCLGRGRYLILFFNSMLVFGFYFCTDLPSAVQSLLQNDKGYNCSESNVTCCSECLGLGPVKYNMLYSVYSWTNAVLVFPVGVLIDRIGIRISGILFAGIGVAGTTVFAISSVETIRGTSTMFYLMAAGRLLLGAGTGAARITQDRVVALWFGDKLSFAFGVTVTIIRTGSVSNFFVTSSVAQSFGLATALWLGSAMSVTCFLSAIALCILDWYGSKLNPRDSEDNMKPSPTVVGTLREVRHFPLSFWLVSIMLATYYCFLVSFIANGGKFFEDKYGYSRTTASYINGILYDTSLLLCPLVGQGLDRLGGRALVPTIGGLVTIPLILLLLLLDVSAILIEVLLGITYSIIVIALWPSIAKLVPLSAVGTANGITAMMLHTGSGLTNLGVGKLLGNDTQEPGKLTDNWTAVFIVLIGHLSVMSFAGIIVNFVDRSKGSMLNSQRNHVRLQSTSADTDVHVPDPRPPQYGSINRTE